MKKILLSACFLCATLSYAQDDLLTGLDSTQVQDSYATATFKALQIVTFQTTKMPAKKEFYFVVSHRFGSVKGGIEEFFGLDNATTKLGGIYGVTDWLSVSLSRHTLNKMYETGLKYRMARQSDDFPVDIVGYSVLDINSFLEEEQYPKIEFQDRLSYINQLLVSRKVSEKLSLELIPSFIHKNLYNPDIENDNQFSVGAGGRYKLTKRLSLNVEYMYNVDKPDYYKNPLSVGLDIETGGHVFQLIFTNSQAMSESAYVTNAAGDWGKGDFFFGFNLYRVF
jgi:opacity protein-like surface antigen